MIRLVAATLAALIVNLKSLQAFGIGVPLGALQTGAPTTPVVFSTSVSVYVIGPLVGVSVPFDGVASGAFGPDGAEVLAVLLARLAFPNAWDKNSVLVKISTIAAIERQLEVLIRVRISWSGVITVFKRIQRVVYVPRWKK
jgi:hypothetical protein